VRKHPAELAFIVLVALLAVPALAYSTPESIAAAGKVYVSSIVYDPATFFPGDKGTVTFAVTNGNNDTGVMVKNAVFADVGGNFRQLSGTSGFSSTIGPGKTQTFTFTIRADCGEGTYYPFFSLDFRDGNSLNQQAMVQVENLPLELTVVDKPDAFSTGKKKTIYMKVANPRKGPIKNVALAVSGEGIAANPSRTYLGTLESGATIPVNFSVTPEQQTSPILTLDFDNGDKPHTIVSELPLIYGVDKKRATPLMSNIQVKNENGVYHVSGDVNNAGLETANTVTVTSLPPAVPEDPYKIYVVGALKPDDFGSFIVTFSARNTTSVPIQLSYKDADGNVYSSQQNVTIPSSWLPSTSGQGGAGSGMLPLAIGIIVVVVFVGGWVLYLKRAKK
jgi:hypothetical protein